METTDRTYKPVWHCIYCSDGQIRQATKYKLSGEHIIPFGLGGTTVLPRASCHSCARITGAIEQSCLRTMLGATRIRLNLPTRRPNERPKELQITLLQGSKTTERTIPAREFPLVIPGLLLPPPGLLTGAKPHDSMVGKFWMSREVVADKYLTPGGGYRAGTFNNHVFMQMLAKIAHSFAVAEWGFHSFIPLLRDLIVGSSQTASYWVGGNGEPKPPDLGGLHRLELKRELRLGTEYVVCYVRLFAMFGASDYRIVVGTSNFGR